MIKVCPHCREVLISPKSKMFCRWCGNKMSLRELAENDFKCCSLKCLESFKDYSKYVYNSRSDEILNARNNKNYYLTLEGMMRQGRIHRHYNDYIQTHMFLKKMHLSSSRMSVPILLTINMYTLAKRILYENRNSERRNLFKRFNGNYKFLMEYARKTKKRNNRLSTGTI